MKYPTLWLPTLACAYTVALSTESRFNAWRARYNREYSTVEELERRQTIFAHNLELHERHNADPTATFTMGSNQFTDLTHAEFAARYLGGYVESNRATSGEGSRGDTNTTSSSSASVPDSIDWRQKGAVTAEKDQGNCGSCWAFSAVGAIEAANAIAGKGLKSLSEQELVSCDTNDLGCQGGAMDHAFKWIMGPDDKRRGLCSETDFPYTSGDGLDEASAAPFPVKLRPPSLITRM